MSTTVMGQPSTHFIAVGACYIDTILAVPEYPSEDAKQRASSLTRRRGGNCPNALEVLQQLYPPSWQHEISSSSSSSSTSEPFQHQTPQLVLLSTLPSLSSPDTQFIRNSLTNSSHCAIDMSHAFHRDDSTAASSYIIRSQFTNSRTIVNYNNLLEMTVPEFQSAITTIIKNHVSSTSHASSNPAPAPAPNPARLWVHFEGRIPDTTRKCIDWLRTDFQSQPITESTSPPPPPHSSSSSDHDATPTPTSNSTSRPNVTISVECEKPKRGGLDSLADIADVVFYSRSWAEGKGYTTAEQCLLEEGHRIRSARTKMEMKPGLPEQQEDMSIAMSMAASVKTVVLCCTWGEAGAAALTVDLQPELGNEGSIAWDVNASMAVVQRPSWTPETGKLRVVDTIGAGDTWIAGMLFGFLSRPAWLLGRRIEVANELAGRKVGRDGFAGLGRELGRRLA